MESTSPLHVVEDASPYVQLLSDGTVVRFDDYNTPAHPRPPCRPPRSPSGGETSCTTPPEAASGKLPLLVYFHGGGFFVGTFELPNFHAWCQRLAGELPAVVLSADYRLAPGHRLPAAFDDAATVMSWVRGQAAAAGDDDGDDADPWLAESADFSRVFVAGDSAGGNMVHNVLVRVGAGQAAVDPARVAGYVLLCPFFGGEQRTDSEEELPPASDQCWRMVLPPGSTRDHPFGPDSPALDSVAVPPTLVVAAEHDQLRDRDADYAARLKAMGKPVQLAEFEGQQQHCFFFVEPSGDAASELVRTVRRFVYGNGGEAPVAPPCPSETDSASCQPLSLP